MPADTPEAREALLASLSEGDLMYDYPVAQSGEPMDPVLFVRWDALAAAPAPDSGAERVRRSQAREVVERMAGWTPLVSEAALHGISELARQALSAPDSGAEERLRRLSRYAMVGNLNSRHMDTVPDGEYVLLSDVNAALSGGSVDEESRLDAK